MSREITLSGTAFALAAVLYAGPVLAKDFVDFPHDLTANQFASNCKAQGGSASVVSATSDGSKAINCNQSNGSHITCAFDNAGAVCVGSTGGSGGRSR